MQDNNSLGFKLSENNNFYNYQFSLNYINKKQIIFDTSFIEFNYKNSIFGIGKVNRHWSFSPYTSLILSKNARPSNSIYFKTSKVNKPRNYFLSWAGPWSLEIFNSILSSETKPKKPMLLGTRLTFEPIENLRFELLKTSQWGGYESTLKFDQFSAALVGDSNDSKYAKINQLAGFGVSYLVKSKQLPTRIYGQFIGEDEAGNLPSCFMNLFGAELELPNTKPFSKFGFELVDTRIDYTTRGFCGPNTAYNNNSYNYTNYNTSIGAPIDSESKSLSLWGYSKFSKNMNIFYSMNKMLLNASGWSAHRLSSTRKQGWLYTFGATYIKNSIKIKKIISYQDFSLDKQNIPKNLSINFNAQYSF
jgi:hypothetical protein